MKSIAKWLRHLAAAIAGLTLLSVPSGLVMAHGPLHEQIADMSTLITQYHDSAGLYLRRGELYRHHGDWREALMDYERAGKLDPKLTVVDWCRGQLLLEAGQLEPSKRVLDRLLAKIPTHGDGYLTRGRVLAKLGKPLAAAEDFSRAITYLIVNQPDYYLERAQALASAGEAHIPTALRGLDEGMQQFGPLVSLQLFAIDLEIKQKSYDGALARLERVTAQSPRKEMWLLRRGEILQMAGRHAEACAKFKMALQEIESLPVERRQTKSITDLEKRLRAALQEEANNFTSNQ